MKVDTQHNHPQEPGLQLTRNTLRSTSNRVGSDDDNEEDDV